MWIADGWSEYELLDTSSGEKLERWGDYILIRPDPQVIWETAHDHPAWKKKNAHYHRSHKGGGEWEFIDLPDQWDISYKLGSDGALMGRELCFHLKPFRFKHTGVFPEQATNWEWMSELVCREHEKRGIDISEDIKNEGCPIQAADERVKVLNLFAYTGGATLALAASGAYVTHVDASKGMVGWAKENAVASGLKNAHIRYLTDDCVKFVERESRRGSRYDAIVMDPPSYGRGPKGELWKIEDNVFSLIKKCVKILSDKPLFFLINSYTTGLAPAVLDYMMRIAICERYKGSVTADEIGLSVSGLSDIGAVLPCGASGRYTSDVR